MSGGSHDYICYKMESELAGQMEDAELNDLVEDVIKLAHDLEWYHSDDTSRDSYRESVRAFKKKWFTGDREKRLKEYIDKRVDDMREELYLLIADKET